MRYLNKEVSLSSVIRWRLWRINKCIGWSAGMVQFAASPLASKNSTSHSLKGCSCSSEKGGESTRFWKWWVNCLSKRCEIIWWIQCCRSTWNTSEVLEGGWLQSPQEVRPPPSWRTNGGLCRSLQGICFSSSSKEKSWPWWSITPIMHFANAVANNGGYSAVYRLRYVPDSVRTPAICWWEFAPCGQRHAREETSAHVVQNIQLFAQSRSKWHAATTVQWQRQVDMNDCTSGSCQDIALGGCSKWLWPPASNVRLAHKTHRVNIKRLSCTESKSSAEMPGFPSRNSGVRNAGGPLGFREYSLHAGEFAL